MGIGISVFLIAVGAILTFAVEISIEGLDLGTVGIILMIAGAIGLLWSLMFLNRATGAGTSTVISDDVVDEPVAGSRRRMVRRERF